MGESGGWSRESSKGAGDVSPASSCRAPLAVELRRRSHSLTARRRPESPCPRAVLEVGGMPRGGGGGGEDKAEVSGGIREGR